MERIQPVIWKNKELEDQNESYLFYFFFDNLGVSRFRCQ